jgi:HD-GYP domain-containing protein (c-di-GMP phosphodiesterase class II)
MYEHQDVFAALNGKKPLLEKLEYVHSLLRERFDFLGRIAVAVYDPKTDLLKTFIHSSEGASPLSLYSAKLSDTASLKEILQVGRPRLVNDLEVFRSVPAEHARRIAAGQYQSSYTMPMIHNDEFFGFLFFNAYRKNAFDENTLHYIDMIGHLLALLVMQELSSVRALQATVKTATGMTQHRDPETGAHLDRMSNYARLIAREVAPLHRLNDDMVEHIFMFSPLHDIGKIGIPDSILHKPARLNEQEYATMKTHTAIGGDIIDQMLSNLGMEGLPHADILRNIARYHHEAINGSGYRGLQGEAIPIEARIVAVADVFDALTSVRPYKGAWSNDQAFDFLQSVAGTQFDADCVAALMRCRSEVESIQRRFKEDPLG